MNARFHLRDFTRAAHRRTDAAFSVLDLTQRDDYGIFLKTHLLAYRAMMPVFEADLPAERRPPAMADLLVEDLHALGLDPPRAVAPDFDGDALGAAYVVAGSHFGQRVLSGQHGRSGDAAVRGARRYLSSPALKTYWPILQKAIEQAMESPRAADRLDQLSAGAEKTFALFDHCLTLVLQEGACHEFA